MEQILSEENLKMAIKKVKKNKGAPGIDEMTVEEIEYWFKQYQEELTTKILNKQYQPIWIIWKLMSSRNYIRIGI